MRLRPRTTRVPASRPTLDALETRELLSHVAAPMAEIASRGASIIGQLAKAPLTTASTVPSNGDLNPYGVAFVPSGFPTGGVLNPGDVLVSNWNDSKNASGTGTTIVRVTPSNQTSVFYQGPASDGLSTALGVLQAGYVLVGDVPASFGTTGPVGMGALVVLDKNGNFVTSLNDPNLLDGPWDLAINDQGTQAQIFVSSVLNGTVSRFDVSLPASGGFQVTSETQIASGYKFHTDPSAVVVGPTGLAYNAATNTLYVASTANNAVYAIANAGSASTQSGTGKLIYKDNTHLHGPLGLTMAADGNLIAAQGDAINANKRQTSELVEFTPKGKFVGQFSLSKSEGGAFGVATSPDGLKFAAVNDITNSVEIWQVKP